MKVKQFLSRKKRLYVYRLQEGAAKVPAGWKPGMDYQARAKRLCELKSPEFLEDLRRHRVLSTAGFVRTHRGQPNATKYWPYQYDMILGQNPAGEPSPRKYAPEKLA